MTVEETFRPPFQLTVHTPVDLIAAVPYLVGFHPLRSLVVLGVDADTGTVAFAAGCDLTAVAPADPAGLAERLAAPFVQVDCRRALIVGYGPGTLVTPGVDALRARLARLDVLVVEALRLAEDRYWSYVCPEPECCPAEGVRYDVHGSAVPAMAVAAGLRVRADRAELRALTLPVTGAEAAAVDRATLTAEARCARLWGRLDPGGHAPFATSFTAEGIRAVRTAVTAALDGAPPPDAEAAAWLGVLLVGLRVRDEAWAHIDHERAAAHVGLWSHVLRRVAPAYAAAPAALLAFAAWQNEDPLLAEAALDRVASADPGYSMALLIRQALRHGVSPRHWRGFTPEWLGTRSPAGDPGTGTDALG